MVSVLFKMFAPGAYECACCGRTTSDATYREGAFFCQPCARGEHRHAGYGTKVA
jgi:hypothetical protein